MLCIDPPSWLSGRLQQQAYALVRQYLDERTGSFVDTPEVRGLYETLHRAAVRDSAKTRISTSAS